MHKGYSCLLWNIKTSLQNILIVTPGGGDGPPYSSWSAASSRPESPRSRGQRTSTPREHSRTVPRPASCACCEQPWPLVCTQWRLSQQSGLLATSKIWAGGQPRARGASGPPTLWIAGGIVRCSISVQATRRRHGKGPLSVEAVSTPLGWKKR